MIRDLLRSTPFRITILYMLLYTFCSAATVAFIYVRASNEFEKTLRQQIQTETAVLKGIFDDKGLDALTTTIKARYNAPATGVFLYAVLDKSDHQIVGDLSNIKLVEGWSEVYFKDPATDPTTSEDEGETTLLMLGSHLSNGDLLIVGAGMEQAEDLREIILRALFSSLALALPLTLLGGVLLSRTAMSRVSRIHNASRSIMAGNLSRRLPILGSKDEFDRLSISINAMLERIEELMGSMKRVTNDVAHDLRTPLGHLRQRLEAALTGEPTIEACLDALEKGREETDRILETFDALLQIGQIEALDMRKRFTAVDLSELAMQLVESYRPVAAEKNQQLHAEIAPNITVRGFRELLAQMLVNLIENAINHSPEGAGITLRLAREAGRLALTLTDTGPGIPAEYRDKVFQPFYRLEESRTTPGNGLGLALVRSIATIHRVKITLGGNNPGLVVSVAFPVPEKI